MAQRGLVDKKHYPTLGIKVDPKLKETIRETAEAQGLSVSQYVRFLILRELSKKPKAA